MKLEEIAQVMIGILVKREKRENGKNSYPLFSLKNYEEKQNYETIEMDKDLGDKLAKEGDLLFRLLYPNKIIYVSAELEGMAIPSQFCIIRPKKEEIDSIVLKWYLESEKVEEERKLRVTGSIIQSISVTELKKIEIPNIPIERQKDMKKLITLWEKEKQISEQIMQEKEKLYNYYLERMIEKGEDYVRTEERGNKEIKTRDN